MEFLRGIFFGGRKKLSAEAQTTDDKTPGEKIIENFMKIAESGDVDAFISEAGSLLSLLGFTQKEVQYSIGTNAQNDGNRNLLRGSFSVLLSDFKKGDRSSLVIRLGGQERLLFAFDPSKDKDIKIIFDDPDGIYPDKVDKFNELFSKK